MTYYINFECRSCQHTQPATAIDPVVDYYLSGSVCVHCGQVIPTSTKRAQLKDHIQSSFRALSRSA
ncbi:hypothetical protein [Aquirhabdus parva]|uniref:hypothetical protein n=1 Tax=Aquirhabdus parva TaxID=2283318 RepID=UPI0013B359D7|nr:hypothetical protein [Aquirhabdus parva]